MHKKLCALLALSPLLLISAPLLAQTPTTPPGKTAGDLISRADANGDGKVSRDEFLKYERSRAEQVFDRLDTNKDGFIDKNELAAAREKWKQRRGGANVPPSK